MKTTQLKMISSRSIRFAKINILVEYNAFIHSHYVQIRSGASSSLVAQERPVPQGCKKLDDLLRKAWTATPTVFRGILTRTTRCQKSSEMKPGGLPQRQKPKGWRNATGNLATSWKCVRRVQENGHLWRVNVHFPELLNPLQGELVKVLCKNT